MQKGHRLHFKCKDCKEPIHFSVFELETKQHQLQCSQCHKHYALCDNVLIRQIRKFEVLCRTLCDSEEILGQASVGINVGDLHVKVPYKLLLTRLSSSLDLEIENEPVSIVFRIEPCQDVPKP
jgi:hypothetical protein